MKVTIEHFVVKTEFSPYGNDNYHEALGEFNNILCVINLALDGSNLRDLMLVQKSYITNFSYGFGSNHMWVHQIIDGNVSKNRLLIVEF